MKTKEQVRDPIKEDVTEVIPIWKKFISIQEPPSKSSLITQTILLFGALFVMVYFIDEADTLPHKLKRGFTGLCLLGVIVFFFLLPRTRYTNWKARIPFQLAQAGFFVYFLNLLLLLLFDYDTVRYLLVTLDPTLNNELPPIEEKDCRLYTPDHPKGALSNIKDNIDIFVLSHVIGWIAKGVIFRNNYFCWLFSISFELYELSLGHWVPIFCECWWDAVIVDVLCCNALGIVIGNYIVKWTRSERYHWFFEPTEKTNNLPYFERFWVSIKNLDYYRENGKWHFLSNPYSFLSVFYMFFITSWINLSNFVNNQQLGIPQAHYLLVIRIVLIGLNFIPTVEDFYNYLRDKSDKKRFTFIMVLAQWIALAEFLLFLKNYQPELYMAKTSNFIIAFWIAASIGLVSLFSISLQGLTRKTIN